VSEDIYVDFFCSFLVSRYSEDSGSPARSYLLRVRDGDSLMVYPSEMRSSLEEHVLVVRVYRHRGLALSIHFLSLDAGVLCF